MSVYKSINPFTEELLKDFSLHTEEQVSEKVQKSAKAFQYWRNTTIEERIEFIKTVQAKLISQKEELATLITLEMGKPLTESLAEIEKCAVLCDYYMSNAKGFLNPRKVVSSGATSEIHFQALGTVLAIMPWNFPFWQVFRFAIPNLLVGNVCLHKHAPNVPQCALALEELFTHTQEELFINLFVTNEQVEHLIADDVVQGVTLTGSNKAGEAVGLNAGKHIKKMVLELGGNDAFIVLKDADLKTAAEKLYVSRFLNTGQSCIAGKRLIIDKTIKDEFLKLFIEIIKQKVHLGDPLSKNVTMGVIARRDLTESLFEQVSTLLKKGGEVLFELKNEVSANSFPLLIINTTKVSMNDRDFELFGPVLQVIEFENEEEVTILANETKYGLGCSVWTENQEKARALSLLIDVGTVSINEIVFSAPYLPFGGVKKSGLGRELGKEGLIEFTNVKSVYLKSN